MNINEKDIQMEKKELVPEPTVPPYNENQENQPQVVRKSTLT